LVKNSVLAFFWSKIFHVDVNKLFISVLFLEFSLTLLTLFYSDFFTYLLFHKRNSGVFDLSFASLNYSSFHFQVVIISNIASSHEKFVKKKCVFVCSTRLLPMDVSLLFQNINRRNILNTTLLTRITVHISNKGRPIACQTSRPASNLIFLPAGRVTKLWPDLTTG